MLHVYRDGLLECFLFIFKKSTNVKATLVARMVVVLMPQVDLHVNAIQDLRINSAPQVSGICYSNGDIEEGQYLMLWYWPLGDTSVLLNW